MIQGLCSGIFPDRPESSGKMLTMTDAELCVFSIPWLSRETTALGLLSGHKLERRKEGGVTTSQSALFDTGVGHHEMAPFPKSSGISIFPSLVYKD